MSALATATATATASPPARDPATAVGRVVDGRYQLVALLGTGGTSAVYRARHLTTGRPVALKLLDEGLLGDGVAVQRFVREARATAQVAHPNVVEVLDAGVDGAQPYLVTEYLEGETLAARIARAPGAMELREAAALVLPLFEGLAAAHRAGIVHRDLKPENVILHRDAAGDGRPAPTLVDFGFSKVLRSAGRAHVTLTLPGVVFGTPHYLSPEQALSPRNVDARADVWAAGVLLYRLLCGRVPFDGKNPGEVLGAVFDTTPRAPSSFGVPAPVSQVITRCLEKDPARRYADASELLRALCASLGLPEGYAPARRATLPSLRVPAAVEPQPTVRPPALGPLPAIPPAPRVPRVTVSEARTRPRLRVMALALAALGLAGVLAARVLAAPASPAAPDSTVAPRAAPSPPTASGTTVAPLPWERGAR